jgi:general secretion pathway protein E
MPTPAQIGQAQGCDTCGKAGYRGRVGVYDLVEIDDTLRTAIDRAAPEAELRSMTGGNALLRDALAKVAAGQTDMAEIDRVLGSTT